MFTATGETMYGGKKRLFGRRQKGIPENPEIKTLLTETEDFETKDFQTEDFQTEKDRGKDRG